MNRVGLRVGLATLLVVSAVGFGVASAAERSREHVAGASLDAPEGSAAREAAEGSPASSDPAPDGASRTPGSADGETLLGVRTESVGTTAAVVALLALMAVLVLAVPSRRVLFGVAVLALLLAVLDLREAVHQHDESRAGLVAAAVALAAAHLGAAALSVVSSQRT